jgi:hypothetical protein
VGSALATAGESDRAVPRTLAGHRYISTNLLADPFITSHVRTRTGFGLAFDLKTPYHNLAGVLIDNLVGDIAFVNLEFGMQWAVSNWLAVRGDGEALVRVGTNEVTLISQGASVFRSFSLGPVVRVWSNSRAQISLAAEATRGTDLGLTPLDFVRRVIEAGELEEENSLLYTTNTWRFLGGVRAAYTLWDWAGLTGAAEFGQGDSAIDPDESEFVERWGFALGMDLADKIGAPLGVTITYVYDSIGLRKSPAVRTTGLGILYTGSSDYTFGVEATYIRIPFRNPDITVETLRGSFNVRLYM